MNRAFIDLDGVLVDFQTGAALKHGVDVAALRASNLDILDFTKIHKARFYGALDRDFWAGLDWTPEGREILGLVEGFFQQDDIFILSSAVETPGCYDGKKAWIRKHAPRYGKQFYVGPSKYGCSFRGAILLDDRDTVAEDFRRGGGHAILVPRPWNKNAGQLVLETVQRRLAELCN